MREQPVPNGRNLTLIKNTTRTRLKEVFTEHFPEPSKVVAGKGGQSFETVEGYKQVNVPASWAQLIHYCRLNPGFALEVAIEMGLEFDRDRESYAAFLQLTKQVRGE